jgi:uncharacterized alkaline shock family protein YloU
MSDEAEFHAERTQEMFLPATFPAVLPHSGGAEVVEVAAYRGTTEFDSEVVEKLASAAARSVPGVAELGGDVARFFNAVLDRIGLDKAGDATRGVSARMDGTDVAITVVLVIAAGEVHADVAAAVRTRVIEAVEHHGLHVTNVDVKVDDILLTPHP